MTAAATQAHIHRTIDAVWRMESARLIAGLGPARSQLIDPAFSKRKASKQGAEGRGIKEAGDLDELP